jgi:outer membrane lipopolysaccharide assembly protein LptE/RlpB
LDFEFVSNFDIRISDLLSFQMQKANIHLKKIRKTAISLVVLVTLAGCGYHFKGMGVKAPEGVSTIAIAVLKNRTSESGIETVFTNDLSYEFTRSKVLRVVGKDAADAVLSGTIMSLKEETISRTASYESDERRVTITLDLALKRADGEVIWSDRALSDKEAFKVDPSNRLATQKNKRVALEAISDRLAEKIHDRILQGF